MKKAFNVISFSVLALIPAMSFAADPLSFFQFQLLERPATGDLTSFIESITTWILGFVGALAVLFIIYGGILFITSAGNTKRVETAKKTLTYAIIGLIVVILARVVLQLLTGSFGAIIGTKGVTL